MPARASAYLEDDQAAHGESGGPGQAQSEMAPQRPVPEGPANGELHGPEGWEPFQHRVVRQRVAERVLQEGVPQAAHDDEEEPFQVALDQYAEQQPEGSVGQGHDGEPGPDRRPAPAIRAPE